MDYWFKKILNLQNLSSARNRTARFLLAGACVSYVSCVHCVACVACVTLDGKPARLRPNSTGSNKLETWSETRFWAGFQLVGSGGIWPLGLTPTDSACWRPNLRYCWCSAVEQSATRHYRMWQYHGFVVNSKHSCSDSHTHLLCFSLLWLAVCRGPCGFT